MSVKIYTEYLFIHLAHDYYVTNLIKVTATITVTD